MARPRSWRNIRPPRRWSQRFSGSSRRGSNETLIELLTTVWKTGLRRRLVGALISASALACGCAPVRMQIEPVLPQCRTVMPAQGPSVSWIAPADDGDRKKLRSWCDAVGPAVAHNPGQAPVKGGRALVVISWNMAVGAGDLRGLIDEVRREHADAELILLLQEGYRAGTPPPECPGGSGRAGALGLPRHQDSADIHELAK